MTEKSRAITVKLLLAESEQHTVCLLRGSQLDRHDTAGWQSAMCRNPTAEEAGKEQLLAELKSMTA